MTSILFLIERIYCNQFRSNVLKKKKLFRHFFIIIIFFFAFLKCTINFDLFLKKMIVIAYVFRKLRPLKNVVRYMSKEFRVGEPFDRQQGKRTQTVLQSE